MLYKLKKKGGGLVIISIDTWMDPNDPWFIKIEWKTLNEKKTKKEITIIRSELEGWIDSFLANDWKIIEQSE